MVFNLSSCIGPDIVVLNKVNVSNALRETYIYHTVNFDINYYYAIVNITLMCLNILLLVYGTQLRKALHDMFDSHAQRGKEVLSSVRQGNENPEKDSP